MPPPAIRPKPAHPRMVRATYAWDDPDSGDVSHDMNAWGQVDPAERRRRLERLQSKGVIFDIDAEFNATAKLDRTAFDRHLAMMDRNYRRRPSAEAANKEGSELARYALHTGRDPRDFNALRASYAADRKSGKIAASSPRTDAGTGRTLASANRDGRNLARYAHEAGKDVRDLGTLRHEYARAEACGELQVDAGGTLIRVMRKAPAIVR